ncbi:hypothetical protein K432DRAFT_377702 [Lepidopterella palustris CBS 459.81]|uniref:Uncharacterized protein n=1 Tax=Lepidopterella palustris CBS 459.81 TaxID=1314670 RepID=A0A8E2EK26_9PEZI|nr:hypothetical protein K432DRAFT_377702 [Lepidopterella palustris CBS 459.81]
MATEAAIAGCIYAASVISCHQLHNEEQYLPFSLLVALCIAVAMGVAHGLELMLELFPLSVLYELSASTIFHVLMKKSGWTTELVNEELSLPIAEKEDPEC